MENKKLILGKKSTDVCKAINLLNTTSVTGFPKVGQNPGKLSISVKEEIIWAGPDKSKPKQFSSTKFSSSRNHKYFFFK